MDKPLQVITFFIGEEEFCIDACIVKSVERMSSLTKVPGISNFIAGAMYSKGNILPIIDLASLGIGKTEFQSYTRIITTEYNKELIGLAVTNIGETVNIPTNINEPIKPLQSLTLGSREVLFLDLNQILQAQILKQS